MMFSRQGSRKKRKVAQEFIFPAPVLGLIRSGTVIGADPRGCEVLENFIPTAEGARFRGGSVLRATMDGAATQLMNYRSGSGEALFAVTQSDIYRFNDIADPEVIQTPEISGLNSGNWSFVQFATSGGQFLVIANGADPVFVFDGTDWEARDTSATNELAYDGLVTAFEVGETVTGGTSGASADIIAILPATSTTGTLVLGAITAGPFDDNEAITSDEGEAVADGASAARSSLVIDGVSSSALSFVWSHKRRLWFVEGGTLSAWYLPVNSIAGTAVEFPLDSIFRLGGSLLFGGTWSQDTGDGLDDYMVFVTTEGEIAVYQGTDPSTAADWSLVGVYVIGKPLNKTAWFRAGGDLVILTEDGIVPVSEALRKDRAALQAAAITLSIEDLWQNAIANRDVAFNFSVSLWSTQTALFIGTPDVGGGTTVLVANTRSGAWATIKGWDIQCSVIYQDRLFFGDSEGRLVEGDIQGNDLGLPYSGRYVPKFQELGASDTKVVNHARILSRSAEVASPRLACFADYSVGQFPTEFDAPEAVGSLWGSAIWGTGTWGGGIVRSARFDWQAVSAQGFAVAPAMIVGSDSLAKPTFEIQGVIIRYEMGRSI
jgi:hypothetical protein